jgi:hypothetical protein
VLLFDALAHRGGLGDDKAVEISVTGRGALTPGHRWPGRSGE